MVKFILFRHGRTTYNTTGRCQGQIDSPLDELAKKHDGETVLIFTHGGIIRGIVAAWSGISIKRVQDVTPPKNTSITVAEYENEKIKLLSFNDVSHLPSDLR